MGDVWVFSHTKQTPVSLHTQTDSSSADNALVDKRATVQKCIPAIAVAVNDTRELGLLPTATTFQDGQVVAAA